MSQIQQRYFNKNGLQYYCATLPHKLL